MNVPHCAAGLPSSDHPDKRQHSPIFQAVQPTSTLRSDCSSMLSFEQVAVLQKFWTLRMFAPRVLSTKEP